MPAQTDALTPLPPERSPWSLKRWWLRFRNGRLMDPGFQAWAASFPLTRGIAKARARQLFDIAVGFSYARILSACVELNVFEQLRDGPLTTTAMAGRLGLSPERARTLLKAAASLQLLEAVEADSFALGELGAALLGNPGLPEMIRHHSLLYQDLMDPVALLRDTAGPTAVGGYWPYAEGRPPGPDTAPEIAAYSSLMGKTQAMIAGHVIAAYDFSRHRALMDVGGGEGVFLSEVAKMVPNLNLTLFDLPGVADRARTRFAEQGLADRAQTIAGSFKEQPLPLGADAISFVRVLHDHDDAPVAHLLRAAHAALPPGGTLVIAEPLAQTPGAEPMGHGYFGMYLLAMGSGRPRTADELIAMTRDAGFRSARLVPGRAPLLVQLIVAVA
jgi:demethylspheroidene O-methyltransferase